MLSFVKSTQLFQDSLMQYNHRINETESFSLMESSRLKYYVYNSYPERFRVVKDYLVENQIKRINTIVVVSSQVLSVSFNNTLLSLNYLRRKFGIRSIVVTDSFDVSQRCVELNILTEPIQEINLYGVPILKSMLLYIQEHYDADQYVYLSSNLIPHPYVFLLSEAMKDHIKSPFLLVGKATSKLSDSSFAKFDYNTYVNLERISFDSSTETPHHYFIFSKYYPFELMLPVVIERDWVHSAVLMLSHSMRHSIVDLAEIECLQMEGDDWSVLKGSDSQGDKNWNTAIMSKQQARKEGEVMSNYRIKAYKKQSVILFTQGIPKDNQFIPIDDLLDHF